MASGNQKSGNQWWIRGISLAKKAKRYMSLYFKMLMQSFKTMLEYKGDFILLMITTIIGQISGLFFIYIIYQNVPTIAGWSFWEIIFICGSLYFSEGIISFLFEGTWLLNRLINYGELDRFLLRPVPIIVQVLSMKMNFDGLGKIILSIVIMSRALMHISVQWNIGKIMMLVVFVVSASVIRVCLNIVANSSSFWLRGSKNSLPHMVYTVWEFGKYPITIFSGAIQFALLTILPYAFMGFLPAAYLFDKPIYGTAALITPAIAILWMMISTAVFKLGLNRYESTGN